MRHSRLLALTIGTPLALIGLVVAAWAIDAGASGGEVMRNVDLAGDEIGGRSEHAMRELLADLAEDHPATTVRIVTSQDTLVTTAGELGLTINQDATVSAALDAGRDGPVLFRPFSWLASFFGDDNVPISHTVDEATVAAALLPLEGASRLAAVEPSLSAGPDGFTVVPGEDGRGLDPAEVAAALPGAARSPTADGDVVVEIERVRIPPRYSEDDAAALAEQATLLTSRPVEVTAGESTAVVPVETLRGWVGTEPTDEALELRFGATLAQTDLLDLLPDVGESPIDASFGVAYGQIVIDPGALGTSCCALDSGERVLAALKEGRTPVALDLTPVASEHDEAWAESMGITALVGEFETFMPGTNRVHNIQTMADIVRGFVIEPGEEFSLNGYVGRRTTEKGFRADGAIRDGVHVTEVGGGVSQFATTTFNAAFFAGLDFVEYQAHSEYFSRYPYGREATVSWPAPDLVVRNSTPYGILIWTSYTSTHIKVSMYSTPYVMSDQTGQTESARGACTRVVTERTRTYLDDGHSDTDTVFAVYRPGEGIFC